MSAYVYEHVVAFAETSLVGNVYFTNYLLWQGHCRERFLREHAPEVVERISRRELAFLTKNCTCEWIGEWGFSALDTARIEMRLEAFRGGRMTLAFEYADARAPDVPVARGTQVVHCHARRGETWVPEPFPAGLARALLAYADRPELVEALEEGIAFHRERPTGTA